MKTGVEAYNLSGWVFLMAGWRCGEIVSNEDLRKSLRLLCGLRAKVTKKEDRIKKSKGLRINIQGFEYLNILRKGFSKESFLKSVPVRSEIRPAS
ncbi:hypothetical protein FTO70_13095 [Methanosarcina sp. KYL-1]|uniref:hypothetical protein n=1 Tax=Methanosarcina sp. KYL-1 TaxID=2602068 RepID=UPI002101784D|nr:hypothetical protein [Methanosarcina sp. KYL-1]MCQ1536590.1 hypothetical protein [Methanosarcina sp. KYL-1]